LLLGQGLAWLGLAMAGLGAWIANFQLAASLSGGGPILRAGLELFAICLAAGVGATEVGMACRMRSGPRLIVAMTASLQGTMLAAALIIGALLIMVGGSMLELMAIGGLPGRQRLGCVRPTCGLGA
jgi:hypothetical protein